MKKGESQKYVKSRTPIKSTTPSPWGNRGSNDGKNLLVVSFIQQGKDEKHGKYGKFEGRRLERGLKTMA